MLSVRSGERKTLEVEMPGVQANLQTRPLICVCVRMNREAQQTLELDWSDKYQAYNFDDHSGRYSNMSPDTQHHPSSATMQDQ